MLFLSIISAIFMCFFFFKQKTAYEVRISDWSSDVCSSDLRPVHHILAFGAVFAADVLDDADIAAVDDDIGRIVIAVEDRREVPALGMAGERGRIVGRAGHQDADRKSTRLNSSH